MIHPNHILSSPHKLQLLSMFEFNVTLNDTNATTLLNTARWNDIVEISEPTTLKAATYCPAVNKLMQTYW